MMKDPAHLESEKLLEEMERKIAGVYRQAATETQGKLGEYMAAFTRKDEQWKKKLEAGEITQKQYDDWRIGQIMTGKRWQEMRDTLADDYHNANEIARSIVNGYMPDVYALNHNYATFEVEKASRVDTSYTLYDRQTVERLIRGDPQILPSPGKRVKAEIAAKQDIAWQEGQIQSVMTQSILQGESIPRIAKRISSTVSTRNDAAAVRYARTATTAAQNAGRVDGYKRAEDMGIQMQQEWIATLDDHVRDSHALLHGETVEVGGTFSNGCRYPGDPQGPASEIWNCRCTLVAELKGFERNKEDLGFTDNERLGGMTYEEWRKAHGG